MAEIKVKLSRQPADLHAERPTTARKPEPPRRAQAQSQSADSLVSCCSCWSVNVVETVEAGSTTYACWNCGSACVV